MGIKGFKTFFIPYFFFLHVAQYTDMSQLTLTSITSITVILIDTSWALNTFPQWTLVCIEIKLHVMLKNTCCD